MKIVGEIPARYGSKRVRQKNLRLLDGKPLIQYAIDAAKGSNILSEVYVNSDSDTIGQLALTSGIKYYKRPTDLGGDETTQDEFNYDFIKQVGPDVLVMVNPVSPLIEGNDIDKIIDHFLENKMDTLIAARDEYVHTFFQGKPVNFDQSVRLQRTQDLEPIRLCAWSVCVWRAETFVKQYEEKGHAAFSGNIGFYPLPAFKSLKISTEEDFILAEILVKNMHRWKFPPVPYDSEQLGPHYPSMWLNEIHHIENVLMEQSNNNEIVRVLEWGAGRSTIYFSKFLKEKGINFKWIAIENFIPWHEQVSGMIESNDLCDVTTCVLTNGTCEERKYLQELMDLSEYVNYPSTLGVKFNLILIDGRRRRECLETASRLVAGTGVVVLHDAERSEHGSAFVHYQDGGKIVCENRSPVPGGVQRLWVGQVIR